MKALCIAALTLAMVAGNPARAELKLPAIFGDNMVLQQQKPVPVWGWCESNAVVKVQFAGQTRSTRADAQGKWLIKLGKLRASAMPQVLVVTGDETQIDLPPHKNSGLLEAHRALKNTEGIAIVEFGRRDVVRHPLVQRIISAYEEHRGRTKTE